MKFERNKLFTLTVSVLLAGLVAAGAYMYLDDKTTKKQAFDFAKGTDAARHHFVSEIERINTEIARLREG